MSSFGCRGAMCAQFPRYKEEPFFCVILTSKTVHLGFCCLLDILIPASMPLSILASFWLANESLVGFSVGSKDILFHL